MIARGQLIVAPPEMSHIVAKVCAFGDQSAPYQLVVERRNWVPAIRSTGEHWLAQMYKQLSLRRRGEVKHVQLPVSDGLNY